MLYGSYGIQALRATVRGFQAEGISIRKRISNSTGLKKDSLWTLKRVLGGEQRYYLLAYGLLRGLTYKQIESNSRSVPDATRLFEVVKTYNKYRTIEKEGRTRVVEWSLEDIQSLLTVEKQNV